MNKFVMLNLHSMKNYAQKQNKSNEELLWFNHQKTSVQLEEVVYLKSLENYTKFYLNCGQVLIASYTMKSYEQKLSGNQYFTRIDRGTVINLKYLLRFETNEDGHFACLSTGEKMGISRRKSKILKLI